MGEPIKRDFYALSARRHPLRVLVSVTIATAGVALIFGGGNIAELVTWKSAGSFALAVAVAWSCWFAVDMIIDACSSAKDQA